MKICREPDFSKNRIHVFFVISFIQKDFPFTRGIDNQQFTAMFFPVFHANFNILPGSPVQRALMCTFIPLWPDFIIIQDSLFRRETNMLFL